jgi:transposase
VGLDVHKKIIACCLVTAAGKIVSEEKITATREGLRGWMKGIDGPWIGGMEATLFTGWIYDFLKPHAQELHVAHPLRLRAITTAKKKSDGIDARTIAQLLRCGLLPTCYVADARIRELRRVLRYRNLLVAECVRMKNRAAGLLMEVGARYEKAKLHRKGYFEDLLGGVEDVPESVLDLLRLSRSNLEVFEEGQKRLVAGLREHPEIRERVSRLMSIPGVGEVTALTWVLEIGDPDRFSSARKAISYCGLCSALNESAGKAKRGPLSKQRNRYLQAVLIEAAKLAPRWNPQLKAVHQAEIDRGSNRNRASLAVARKLVAYLLAVDKSGEPFHLRPTAESNTAEKRKTA